MHELSVHIIDSSIIIVIMVIIMIIITIIILFFSWISYFYHFLASKTILLIYIIGSPVFFTFADQSCNIYKYYSITNGYLSLSLLPCSSIMYSLLNRYLSLIKYLGHILRHPVQNLEPSPLPFGVLPLVTRNRTLDFPPIPSIGYL